MFDAFYEAMLAINYPHPVHATQVHMPIGLVVGAFLLGIISVLLSRQPRLESISPFRASSIATGARICILVAFLFWFTTVGAGIMDWQHFFAGAWIFPIKVKVGLAGFLFIVLCLAIFWGRRTEGMPLTLLGIYAIAALTVVALGFFGGEVAYGDRVPKASEQYRAGQYVFQFRCLGCHPGGSNTIRPVMSLWNSPLLVSYDTFHAWVRSPNPPMPSFPQDRISGQQVRELYGYLDVIMNQREYAAPGPGGGPESSSP